MHKKANDNTKTTQTTAAQAALAWQEEQEKKGDASGFTLYSLLPFIAALGIGLGILAAKIFGVEASEITGRVLLLAETISIPVQETEVISATAMPLGISELTFGIIVALIFGGLVFIMRYGKQCCESITWIIDTCKMNLGKGAGEKGERSNAESSVEELSKETVKIKKRIHRLSQQIRAILAEIKQVRKTAGKNALEDSIETALTEYAMKFELKRLDFEKEMKVLKVALTKIPEEDVAYKQEVIRWIAKAQEKFEDYSPENFGKEVEAVKARRRAAQSKQTRDNETMNNDKLTNS